MEAPLGILNYSRQREAILKLIRSRKDHPTADMIYTALRLEMPNISKGTVYRNLTLLEKLGKIKKIAIKGELTAMTVVSEHQHSAVKLGHKKIFTCGYSRLDRQAGKGFNGTISGHDIFFTESVIGAK